MPHAGLAPDRPNRSQEDRIRRKPPRPGRAAPAAVLVAVALLSPATASAAPCANHSTAPGSPDGVLFDSGGYFFGTNAGAGRDDAYATLASAGSNGPGGTPPGPVANTGTYDSWGALFVGGDALSDLYASPDASGCARELGGSQIAFAPVRFGALTVQRRIYASPAGLPGVRLIESLTNGGSAAVTTSVQVGDAKSADNRGDLGSDAATAVRADSSGDGLLAASDLWAVTSDAASGALVRNATAHVFDGAGGSDRIDFATLSGSDADPADNLAYGWRDVTIPAGDTASFVSFEIQQAAPGLDAAGSAAAAAAQARAYEAIPFEQVYAGLSDGAIAGVRNWPKPEPAPRIAFTPSGPADNAPVRFSDAGSAFSSAAGMCQDATVRWYWGDGTRSKKHEIQHRFKAGQHDVTLLLVNSCGASAVATRHIAVADKTPPRLRASALGSTTLRRLLRGSVRLGLASSESGGVRITGNTVSGTVLKTKRTLASGRGKAVRLRPFGSAVRRLKRLARKRRGASFRVTVSCVATDASGNASKPVVKRIKVYV